MAIVNFVFGEAEREERSTPEASNQLLIYSTLNSLKLIRTFTNVSPATLNVFID